MTRLAAFLMGLLAISLSAPAFAHNRSESFSVWSAHGETLTGTVTVPAREATRVPYAEGSDGSPGQRFADYLALHVVIRAGGRDCAAIATPKLLAADPAFIRVELSYRCIGAPADGMIYAGLFDVAATHVHYARLEVPGGGFAENLFTAERMEWRLPTPDAKPDAAWTLGQFIRAGIGHIANGADHIAFLLALMLAAGGERDILVAVTGFTLGHSLTLVVAVLGLVKPETPVIEAFIGLTIALVAAEYAARRTGEHRALALGIGGATLLAGLAVWGLDLRPQHAALAYAGMAVFAGCYLAMEPHIGVSRMRRPFLVVAAVAFGMVHGFGFAGFLIKTGLAHGDLLAPLFGFNLGVEIGQLAIVCAAATFAWAARRFLLPRIGTTLAEYAPMLLVAALAGLGTYWFIARSFA